ncbi:MAG: cytochrome c nitrite reductase small subunit [bacterium]
METKVFSHVYILIQQFKIRNGQPAAGFPPVWNNEPAARAKEGIMHKMEWLGVLLGSVIGAAAGIGGYTFIYAEGASYLTNDPAACANCHVMKDHFDAWAKSGHHHVAVCNDCHTPHNLTGKYWTKARNGWHHSQAFTTGHFHEPIQITPVNRAVTESACRYCHQDIVQAIDRFPHAGKALSCIQCHESVGHEI